MKFLNKIEQPLSPFATLVTRTYRDGPGDEPADYHSLRPRDYVCVMPVTTDDKIVLVRQFRPVLERETLEFPAGLLDVGQDPESGAHQELIEETGWESRGPMELLGILDPDTGRLENRLWCFLAGDLRRVDAWLPEPGVDPILLSRGAFRRSIISGDFNHALHLAIISLVISKGRFSFD